MKYILIFIVIFIVIFPFIFVWIHSKFPRKEKPQKFSTQIINEILSVYGTVEFPTLTTWAPTKNDMVFVPKIGRRKDQPHAIFLELHSKIPTISNPTVWGFFTKTHSINAANKNHCIRYAAAFNSQTNSKLVTEAASRGLTIFSQVQDSSHLCNLILSWACIEEMTPDEHFTNQVING